MPIYAYKCTACGYARDVLQKMSDPQLTVCPQCHAEQFVKQLTAAGFQLKGSGWYATDFKGGPGAAPAQDGGDAAGSSTAAAEPGASGEGGKTAATAPEKTASSSAAPASTAPAVPASPAASSSATSPTKAQ